MGVARMASDQSLAEMQVELLEVLKLQQRDFTELSEDEYSEWDN